MLRILVGAVGGYAATQWCGVFIGLIGAAVTAFAVYLVSRESN
jgi:hypothetical protein